MRRDMHVKCDFFKILGVHCIKELFVDARGFSLSLIFFAKYENGGGGGGGGFFFLRNKVFE